MSHHAAQVRPAAQTAKPEPTNHCALCRNKGGCGPCIDGALKGYGLLGFRR
jgi:hypothetical protein